MFGFIITASEFYYRIRNMQFLWPVKSTDEMSRRIRDCIPDKVYENLPSITWNVCINFGFFPKLSYFFIYLYIHVRIPF